MSWKGCRFGQSVEISALIDGHGLADAILPGGECIKHESSGID